MIPTKRDATHPNSIYLPSSSVFAISNETDEIINLDETENEFPTVEDLLDQMPHREVDKSEAKTSNDIEFLTANDLFETKQPLRTEYLQRPNLRTKKDKAAQPGFMCPDCASVNIY